MRFFQIILVLLVLTVAHFAFAQVCGGGQSPSGVSSSSQELAIPDARFTSGSIDEIDEELNILADKSPTQDSKRRACHVISIRCFH